MAHVTAATDPRANRADGPELAALPWRVVARREFDQRASCLGSRGGSWVAVHMTTIEHTFRRPADATHSSDGTLYTAANGRLPGICSADRVASRLAPNVELSRRLTGCYLDEPNSLLYVSTETQL
jgi:hypothetical protein